MNPNDKNKTIIHQLRAWLNGDLRRTEEAELFSREDPFLQEALQGYQRFPEGRHPRQLDSIKNKLHGGRRKKMTLPARIAVAAASILLVASTAFFLIRPKDAGIAQSIEATDQSIPQEAVPAPSADEILDAAKEEMSEMQETPENMPAVQEVRPVKPSIRKESAPDMAESEEQEQSKDEIVEEQEAIAEVSPAREIAPLSPPVSDPAAGTTRGMVEKDSDVALERRSLPGEKKKREEMTISPQYYQADRMAAQGLGESTSVADSLKTRHQVIPAIAQPEGGFEKMEIHLDSTIELSMDSRGSTLSDTNFFEVEFQLNADGRVTNISPTSESSGAGNEIDSFVKALKSGPRWEVLESNLNKTIKVRYRYFPFK